MIRPGPGQRFCSIIVFARAPPCTPMTPNGNPDRGPCRTDDRPPPRTAPGETPGRCPARLRTPASRAPARHAAHHPRCTRCGGSFSPPAGRSGRAAGMGRLRLAARRIGVRAVLQHGGVHTANYCDLAVYLMARARRAQSPAVSGLAAWWLAAVLIVGPGRAQAAVGPSASPPLAPVVQRRSGPYDLRARRRLRAGRLRGTGPGTAARPRRPGTRPWPPWRRRWPGCTGGRGGRVPCSYGTGGAPWSPLCAPAPRSSD